MLLELIIALTLSGEVEMHDYANDAPSGRSQESASQDSPVSLNANLQLQERQDYKVSPVEFAGDSNEIRPATEISAAGLVSLSAEKEYLKEVRSNAGCPYLPHAQYLTQCRPEKRQSAWKRIVRESGLFFDRKGMRQFEAISRKYSIL